jgi:type I restriction enzyme S subunit
MSDALILRDCAIQVKHSVKPAIDGQRKYIGLEHIEQGTLRLSGTGFESDVTSTKTAFDKGDVLFGKLRPYFRKVVFASFNGVCSTDIWVLRAKPGVNQRFLYYWVASHEFVDFAVQGADGTRMPRANWAQASQHSIPFQTEHEQKAIAHILGSLDDKIDQLRKTNSVLEKMASALFKSWFVDFDPVMAKQENRPTGLPPELDALFPDSFEDSSLGPIPRGWRVAAMKQLLVESKERIGDRKAPEYASTISGLIPRSELFNKVLSADSSKNKIIRQGDMVFGMSRDKLNYGLMTNEVGSVSSAYKVFRCTQAELPSSFVYQMMQMRPVYYFQMVSSSSREGQSLSMEVFGNLLVVVPPNIVQNTVRNLTSDFESDIRNQQITTLTNLRDTLLPKLISGELRVPEAEQMVAELRL